MHCSFLSRPPRDHYFATQIIGMTVAAAAPAAARPRTAPAKPAGRPLVLLILDGFGAREDAPDNAISNADTPNWDRLLATCPNTTIDASERHVGLPGGQMGNS